MFICPICSYKSLFKGCAHCRGHRPNRIKRKLKMRGVKESTVYYSKTERISKCRYDGWKAAEAGVSRSECPYTIHGPQRASWMGGYWDFQTGLSIGISRMKTA